MFNLVSMAIGAAALCAAMLALLPQFAMAGWLIVPLAALGTAVGFCRAATAGAG